MSIAQSITTPNELRRELDREGCEQGRLLLPRVERLEKCYEKLEGRLDRLFWAMVMAAISLATASIMLGLNLALMIVKP